jgi:hypothetical protein
MPSGGMAMGGGAARRGSAGGPRRGRRDVAEHGCRRRAVAAGGEDDTRAASRPVAPAPTSGAAPLVPIASLVMPAALARSITLTTRPWATPLSACSTTWVLLSW